jgi:hypothetical protein
VARAADIGANAAGAGTPEPVECRVAPQSEQNLALDEALRRQVGQRVTQPSVRVNGWEDERSLVSWPGPVKDALSRTRTRIGMDALQLGVFVASVNFAMGVGLGVSPWVQQRPLAFSPGWLADVLVNNAAIFPGRRLHRPLGRTLLRSELMRRASALAVPATTA